MWNHRVAVAVGAVLVASTAPAQLPDKTPVELYTACIATAINSGQVSLETGAFIRFVCHGDVARVFFEKLEAYDYRVKETSIAGDKVLTMEFDYPDVCWQKFQNASGSPVTDYSCQLNFRGSAALLSKGK